MSTENTDVQAEIVSVKTLLTTPLTIPDYQRPYKWQARQVNQLLDDLIQHRDKSSYRLGTVVLYQPSRPADQTTPLEVVDGQQRLLTLTLLRHFLDEKPAKTESSLLNSRFSASISQQNLQHNAAVIQSRLALLEDIKAELCDFLLHRCQLVQVTLNNLSEAFQFFDSQNSRGKSLAPHDLLKAYHLREMQQETEQVKQQTVAHWEADINPADSGTHIQVPPLHQVMANYLFRIRRWAAGDSGLGFDNNSIGVFKGVNLASTPYPWTEPLKATDCMVAHYNAELSRRWDQQQRSYPFQLDQPMINGKRFFEYVQHYITLWKQLFIEPKTELAELLKTLHSYEGRHRVGDHYVRNLFYCAVLYYYDKFDNHELANAAQLCFRWAYKVRLAKQRVFPATIDNTACDRDSLFRCIHRAQHPHEVLSMLVTTPGEIKATKVDALKAHFHEFKDDNA